MSDQRNKTTLEIEISLLEQIVKKMAEPYVTGGITPYEIVGRMLVERRRALSTDNEINSKKETACQ